MASAVGTTSTPSIKVLVSEALDSVYKNRGEKLQPVLDRFLTRETMKRGQHISYRMAGLGKHSKKGELEPIVYDQTEDGELFTVEPDEYALGYRISRKALKALEDAPYGDHSNAKFISYKAITEMMRDSAVATQDDLAAQLILSANSATATETWQGAGRDGVALAGTHSTLKNPTSSWTNSITGIPFSQQAVLSAISTLEMIPSDEGYLRPVPKKLKIVIGPYNRHRAFEIKNTKSGLDTAASNVNALNDFDWDVVINPHLGASFKGFMIFADGHQCKYFEREKPFFESTDDFEIKGLKISSMFSGKVAHLDPHNVIWVQGF